jgi:hypothetical protein
MGDTSSIYVYQMVGTNIHGGEEEHLTPHPLYQGDAANMHTYVPQ